MGSIDRITRKGVFKKPLTMEGLARKPVQHTVHFNYARLELPIEIGWDLAKF